MIIKRLDVIAQKSPDLADTARLYGAILPVLCDEVVSDPSTGLSAETVRAREEQGIPFLEGFDLEVDVGQVTGLFIRLDAAAEEAGATRVSVEKIRLWIDAEHGGDAAAAFHSLMACDDGLLRKQLERIGLDHELCRFLAQNAMKPLLHSWRRRLTALAAGSRWSKGTCFVCGSAPLIAELQGNDQERHLRCGLCGADWRIARLSCPHCGNEDHRSLRVLFQENDPKRPRIDACDKCMTYLKVIPAFSPTPVDLLPVEDLATLRLDAVACVKGYRRAPEEL